ncbi:protein-translocating porin PorT [Psychroflexus torquis ATCC 700755]|uniref:Protein-translocating porin PorT n=1 Tax=Psychroflexus torquis (strain ATCC 700755 / CIP 106069 / ACAM 623) TaxID=313595 RepID=K4I9Q6_PSYTT|nr:porin family protein [Psychroflexus torquis]AFU67154.1 protein-translocating porin PorT [Psychroflexus torquis ATCC 700755]
MRLIFLLVFLLNFNYVNAQLFSEEKVLNKENLDKKRWSWGYFLGFNMYDFQIKYKDQGEEIKVEKNPSFSVGLIGNFRLNDYVDLRLEPGVVFASRNLNFNFTDFGNQADSFREVQSSYIHIPLLLKFSTKRINNFKPFVIGGASISHNLSSNEDNPQDNSAGQFRLKTQNYYYEVGFGIDFYFDYFKFTPSIRGVFGMNDELVRDENPSSPWTANIESLKTRGIFINFTFQ